MMKLRGIAGNNHGIAAAEFALMLPIIMLLFAGMVELSRFAIIQQKLAKAADTAANISTLGRKISTGKLDEMAVAVDHIMQPFGMAGNGSIVFSSAANQSTARGACATPNVPCITWQYTALGNDTSRIGVVGNTPNLPNGYQVKSNQNVITSEVFFQYRPLLQVTAQLIPALNQQIFYRVAIYKPRQGSLTELE